MIKNLFLELIEKNKLIFAEQLDVIADKYKIQEEVTSMQKDELIKQTEAAITQKNELIKQSLELKNFKNALDKSSIVAITDIDGIITYVNDEFCRVSKFSREELIGQNHRILKSDFHPPEFYKKLWSTITAGKIWKGDVKNFTKDGSSYWVKSVITPLLGSDGKPEKFIAIRTEITKQKEMELKLSESLNKSKDVDRLKEEFMSMVSHELKTPLTPIKLWTSALKSEKIGALNHNQKKALNSITSSVDDLSDLVSDIFDSYKLDLNQVNIHYDKIKLSEIMNDVYDSTETSAKELKISFDNLTDTNDDIYGDKVRLSQILKNLINNALDFVKPNSGKIQINASLKSDSVLFYVKDNGVGILEEHQEKLFSKFYQVDTSSTRHHGGSGLGLSICHGLVLAMNGKIWVDSKIGEGSTFYFSIPLSVTKLIPNHIPEVIKK